ncbi:hypothetical protein M426DRAFT_324110 [Hypoxylon sp. CI-4A]|nr:hypothetical protein M426DRAFT_324110 [Hypoxylon sp. CI-4A]
MKKLYAIADLHLSYEFNRRAFEELEAHPGDGLILCGDLGETTEHLELAFRISKRNFKEVFWCPGNHELYTVGHSRPDLRGEAKYMHCVEVARQHGVHTPEDEFFLWEGGDDDDDPLSSSSSSSAAIIAPIFTLYDYSFRPSDVSRADALRWAEEKETVATDEFLLHPDPHGTRDEWCEALLARFARKMEDARAAHPGVPLVIANHWPLREDLVFIPRVPRFSLWCGTTKTEDWHVRFGAKVVVSGHLHVPRTDWKEGVRFEEVSLGYPRQWQEARDIGKDVNSLLREILPGPAAPEGGEGDTRWRRWG